MSARKHLLMTAVHLKPVTTESGNELQAPRRPPPSRVDTWPLATGRGARVSLLRPLDLSATATSLTCFNLIKYCILLI